MFAALPFAAMGFATLPSVVAPPPAPFPWRRTYRVLRLPAQNRVLRARLGNVKRNKG